MCVCCLCVCVSVVCLYEELELIDAPLRAHRDVLEVRWLIYQKVENWELCENIASALVKLVPERTTGWIHRLLRLARDETHTGSL